MCSLTLGETTEGEGRALGGVVEGGEGQTPGSRPVLGLLPPKQEALSLQLYLTTRTFATCPPCARLKLKPHWRLSESIQWMSKGVWGWNLGLLLCLVFPGELGALSEPWGSWESPGEAPG